jgi:hypothetical protein
MNEPTLFGYLAEFDSPTALTNAAEKVHHEGYRKIDAYTPFPLEAVTEAIGFHTTRLPLVVLCGGLTGLITAFGTQYWISAIDYPINVGGRPFNSWPAFVIVCFELTVLFSAISAVVGMFAMNGLPMPYHPVFNVPRFKAASNDGFFLVIEATDPHFDITETSAFLHTLDAAGVWEVPY